MSTDRSLSSRYISSCNAVGVGVREGAPIARSHPVASDLSFLGTAGSEALGSVGYALYWSWSWWLQLQEPRCFHLSPMSSDNQESCSAAGLSYTRERWIFILPMWFRLSCLSWSARPSYPFWGPPITKAPSILPLRRVDRGRKRSCLGKLSSSCQPE